MKKRKNKKKIIIFLFIILLLILYLIILFLNYKNAINLKRKADEVLITVDKDLSITKKY